MSEFANNQSIAAIAKQVGEALRRTEAKVTTAESCTGGGIAEAITAIAGSSYWFEYGYITYANKAKNQLLNVQQQTLDRYGAVSEQVVQQMAVGAIKSSGADYAIAVSGIAGPDGGTAEKPVGTVWIAWQWEDKILSRCFCFSGGREAVRLATVMAALEGTLTLLG